MAAQERRIQMISGSKITTDIRDINEPRPRPPLPGSGKKRKTNFRIDLDDEGRSQSPASIAGQVRF